MEAIYLLIHPHPQSHRCPFLNHLLASSPAAVSPHRRAVLAVKGGGSGFVGKPLPLPLLPLLPQDRFIPLFFPLSSSFFL